MHRNLRARARRQVTARNAWNVTVAFVRANFIPWKSKGKAMKVRLLQRSGQNDVGAILNLSTTEGEWMVYNDRAVPADGDSAPAQTPSPATENPVRVEDTSPVPERPADDVPVVPQPKRGPGRPPKGDR